MSGGSAAGDAREAPLLPGAPMADGRPTTLGVMGGGQLGRMFVHAAQAMGFETVVLDPDPSSPAGRVAHAQVRAAYDDADGLARLADASAAITTEFENVPASSLAWLAERRFVAPSAAAVAVCQDRVSEKAFIERCGVPCAPHASIECEADAAALPQALVPGILKTSRLGYDGLGQLPVAAASDLASAWQRLGRVPCVLEKRVAIAREISVIVARDAAGRIVHFAPQRNVHRNGILAATFAPAPGEAGAIDATAECAIEHARWIAQALDYVGVLCVEFFVAEEGALVANEMAPRPHNSGHYTIDACDVSQFDLQVRAVAGLPLVVPRQHSAAVMLNLLGDLWFDGDGDARTPPWDRLLALSGAHLHLYGKQAARRGRKMGHVTFTAPSLSEAAGAAAEAAAMLGMPAVDAPAP